MTDIGTDGRALERPEGLTPVLTILPYPCPIADGLALDEALLDMVAEQGGRRAGIWSSEPALIVSRRDTRLPGFSAAVDWLRETHGLPVLVRASGGTAVLQGPDVVTVSLAYAEPKSPVADLNAGYAALRAVTNAALDSLGLTVDLAAVEGAWCDGAHNLVVGPLKLAGTAQRRRRRRHASALAHAAMPMFTDLASAMALLNGFYAAAGAPSDYRPEVCTTVQLAAYAGGLVLDREAVNIRLRQALTEAALDWAWAGVEGEPGAL